MEQERCRICGEEHPAALGAGYHRQLIEQLRWQLGQNEQVIKQTKAKLRLSRQTVKTLMQAVEGLSRKTNGVP